MFTLWSLKGCLSLILGKVSPAAADPASALEKISSMVTFECERELGDIIMRL